MLYDSICEKWSIIKSSNILKLTIREKILKLNEIIITSNQSQNIKKER